MTYCLGMLCRSGAMFLSDSRGFSYETSLGDAAKFSTVSIEATMKSNVSVGPPIEVLCYELDSLRSKKRVRLDEDDPYFQKISRRWQSGIIRLIKELPAPAFGKSVSSASAA